MPEKKTSKHPKCNCKDCHCAEDAMKRVFPICALACVMTATLVTLLFAVSIAINARYQYESQYAVKFSGKFAEEINRENDDNIRTISSGAVIDFFKHGETGFIFASTNDCPECMLFKMRLYEAAKEYDIVEHVFHYHYPSEPNKYDRHAHSMTIANDDGPVLIYVRNGLIYDRLDETNGELSIKTFLQKYK